MPQRNSARREGAPPLGVTPLGSLVGAIPRAPPPYVPLEDRANVASVSGRPPVLGLARAVAAVCGRASCAPPSDTQDPPAGSIGACVDAPTEVCPPTGPVRPTSTSRKAMDTVILGSTRYKRTHTVVVIDERGREVAVQDDEDDHGGRPPAHPLGRTFRPRAGVGGGGLPHPSWRLEADLLAAGERIRSVPPSSWPRPGTRLGPTASPTRSTCRGRPVLHCANRTCRWHSSTALPGSSDCSLTTEKTWLEITGTSRSGTSTQLDPKPCTHRPQRSPATKPSISSPQRLQGDDRMPHRR